jgi:hypothetical protein
MSDPEIMQGGTTEAILLRYFEGRVSQFEKTMVDLRTEIRDQGKTSNELLSKISDKLEERISRAEDTASEQQRTLDKHENFFTAFKWFIAAVGTAVIGGMAAAVSSLFHIGLANPPQINIPPLPGGPHH